MAFRFFYLGWDYNGFAAQENTDNTVEVSIKISLPFFNCQKNCFLFSLGIDCIK